MEGEMKTILSAIVLAAIAGFAGAWALPGHGQEEGAASYLHLSAKVSEEVGPDELVCDLRAQATLLSPADAQSVVNASMKQGMKLVTSVRGVAVSSVGYSVQPVELDDATANAPDSRPPRTGWRAQETLELRASQPGREWSLDSPSADQLWDLVGELRDMGFEVQHLDWRISRDLGARSLRLVTEEVLFMLRDRAESAASGLGLRVDRYRNVRLDVPDVFPVQPMSAKAGGPPWAAPLAQPLTGEVTADVVLRR
jgi:predicted secreted protein